MRVEPCVCGGIIRAGSWENSRQYVEAHNRTIQHMTWRWRMGIFSPIIDGSTPHDDPRRHWPTADESDVDLSLGTPGASASGVEASA